MFLLGLLSLIQLIFLPGFLLLKFIKFNCTGVIQRFLYGFALSLTFNYYLVCFLVVLKIYTLYSLYIFFILELFLLIYLILKGDINFHKDMSIQVCYARVLNYPHRILMLISIAILIFFISLIYTNTNTIFYFTDGIARKPWIESWASNNFFTYGHYLQFLPTNLSIINIFTQSVAPDFLTKIVMILFFVGNLLIFLDLYSDTKQSVHLIGYLFYALFLLVFYGILFISDFNYDIPVSFFGFISFYVILKNGISTFNFKNITLVTILALSAANIKIVGLFSVSLSLLWFLYLVYINKREISKGDLIKSSFYLGLIYIIGLFWYLFVPVDISGGIGPSPFKPYQGLLGSFNYGMKMIYFSFGPHLSMIILILLIGSLFTPVKYIPLVIISPLFIVWVFWYNYDSRNLSLIIPFCAFAMAYGLEYIIIKINYILKRLALPRTGLNNKEPLSNKIILFGLSIVGIFLLVVINSNLFFNIALELAYLIRNSYFNYNNTIFTIEFGYYRYIIYYVTTLSVSVVLISIFLFLRKSNIKISQIVIVFVIGLVILNFTLFKRNNILLAQKYDEEKVKIHNLYFEIHTYLKNTNGYILTNSRLFEDLILPGRVRVLYTKNINQDTVSKYQDKRKIQYAVLVRRKIQNVELDKLTSKYSTYVDNQDFIFLETQH